MNRPGDLGPLGTAEWERLQDLLDRFESAWQGGQIPDLAAYLPPPGDVLRPVALHELVKTDLEVRWRRGLPAALNDYLTRFAELGGAEGVPARLLYEEYRVRHLHGDAPQLSDYRARYPAQYAEMQRLLQEEPVPTMSRGEPTPPSQPANAPAMTIRGQSLLAVGGGYRLIERIGCGGFGEVWLAEAPGGVRVAVKVIFRPLTHEEAKRELQALEVIKNLKHHFLLQTHAYWPLEDRLIIAMELADGSLRDRLKQCRQQGLPGIPADELLGYFREAAEAIDFLHSKEVLHLDVKPENILLVGRHVKVADFGLVREQEAQRSVSVSGSGTPAYMAPEIWRGKASHASDLYSLAVAWVELRRDGRPFPSRDLAQLMFDHLEKEPDLAPLPEAEQQVLRRALHKEAGHRFGSCLEFVQALERMASPARATPAPPLQPTQLGRGAQTGKSPAEAETRAADSDQFDSIRPGGWKDDAATSRMIAARAEADDKAAAPTERTPLKPEKGGHGLLWLALALLVVLLGAGLASWRLGLFSIGGQGVRQGKFTLVRPEPLTLTAGQEADVEFGLTREHFARAVHLSFVDLPPGVVIADASFAGDADRATVHFKAAPDAVPGSYDIMARAKSDDPPHEAETVFQLVIAPRPGQPSIPIPAGCEPDLAKGVIKDLSGRSYYAQVVLKRDDLRVAFVLVPQKEPGDPPTFYLMRDKVWNDLFRRFAASHPEAVKGSQWERGGKAGGLDVGTKDGRLPVLRVKSEEARQCAAWLGGLLPTAAQWDRAVGPWPPAQGAKQAINRRKEGPLPVGAVGDVGPLGVQDLAGNGRELTRDVLGQGAQNLVVLRGCSYTVPRLPTLEDLKEQTQFVEAASPYTGFRVVIEMN